MNWDVFKKPNMESKKESTSTSPAKPSNHAMPPQPSGPETGSDVDFDSLPADEKMAAYLAATQYNGTVDPSRWAQYWSQKEGLMPDGLVKFASYVKNIVGMSNGLNADDIVDDQRWPWWSAARSWNPGSEIWGNKQWNGTNSILDSFTPTPAMVNAIKPRF